VPKLAGPHHRQGADGDDAVDRRICERPQGRRGDQLQRAAVGLRDRRDRVEIALLAVDPGHGLAALGERPDPAAAAAAVIHGVPQAIEAAQVEDLADQGALMRVVKIGRQTDVLPRGVQLRSRRQDASLRAAKPPRGVHAELCCRGLRPAA
jgi:hypothetical protein